MTIVIPKYFNPLLIGIPKDRSKSEFIARNFFDFYASGTNFTNRCNNLLKRNDRFRKEVASLNALPFNPDLHAKVIAPLKQAYGAFVTGNYLSTLAQCGMIGEMIAIFDFEVGASGSRAEPIDPKKGKPITLKRFEELGQEARISILLHNRFIDSSCSESLGKIRNTRNNYLHLWSQSHQQVENDAYQVLCEAIKLIKATFFLLDQEQKTKIKPEVGRYLSTKFKNDGDTVSSELFDQVWMEDQCASDNTEGEGSLSHYSDLPEKLREQGA